MQFPAIIQYPDGTHLLFQSSAAFSDDVGTKHPADAWNLWSADDWAAVCPNLIVRPVVDPGPSSIAGKRAIRLPIEAWEIGVDAVTVTYATVDLTPAEVAAQLTSDRAAKVSAIDAERDRRLALGALHQGKRFSMGDSSRTDQGGMATTAALVLAGALSWPESYAQGWIALDNTRLPLPTPAEGIALAATVGVTYSATVQHARDLKDAALTGNPAAVNELAGWPD